MSRRQRKDELRGPIAVRAYTPPTRERGQPPPLGPSGVVLVLDAETTTDAAQRLTFASYRVYREDGALFQEGLVAADDLPAEDWETLERYVEDHPDERGGRLRLLTRTEFVEGVLWPVGYLAGARIVGFNLPFDLSRLAVRWAPDRARRRGRRAAGAPELLGGRGFSLRLFEWDDDGVRRAHPYRPNVRVRALDSKRQLVSFTGCRNDAWSDAPEGSRSYQGRFLDLHTLAYVLTDRSLSLDAAAEEFGLAHRKDVVERHGVVTPEYVDYNRQDVRLTHELYLALMEEWDRHPVALDPERAFSPAAVGKAYLRAMGVRPPMERPGHVPDAVLGYAMAAYYGGRTEARIRGVELPARYVDFTSMYPTVFVLQGLWRWVTCDHFEAEDATEAARQYLGAATREGLHAPAAWPPLAGVLCRVRPAGELLPARARYGRDEAAGTGGAAWTIGLNPLAAGRDLWYTLADLVAARLLGGRAPEVLEAVRIVPVGTADGLQPVALRGSVRVDPVADDLFRRTIEERQRVKGEPSLPEHERKRLDKFLKVLANGASYGVFAEFRQLDGRATVDGLGLHPFRASVASPEEPGEFCFPPLAASITGAGRLLLALAQADVEAAGGTYIVCDTDSLVVVSTPEGGLVACPGGPHRLPDGTPAVRALSWAEVDEARGRINALNPYDRDAIPELLKLEKENLPLPAGPLEAARGDEASCQEPTACDPALYAVALSSKRYALYNRTSGGGVAIRKASSHGLGLYRSPVPRADGWDREWPEWVEDTWRRVIAEARGEDPGREPGWYGLPAVSQASLSTPALARLFDRRNTGRGYADQVKPFGFLLVGHVDPLAALPAGLDRPVTPVAPYSADAAGFREWDWVDRRTGRPVRVTTREGGESGRVRLRTYRDVVDEYVSHPEQKSGRTAVRRGRIRSVGVLPRLHVAATDVRHVGKESNRLDEEEEGLEVGADEAFTEFRDERAEWRDVVLPRLQEMGAERVRALTGASERTVRSWIREGRVPRQPMQRRLRAMVSMAIPQA